MTFKEAYLTGRIEFGEIDGYIETWNRSDGEQTLAAFLGLSGEEEDAWIEESDDALKKLLDARGKVAGTPVLLGKTGIMVNKNGLVRLRRASHPEDFQGRGRAPSQESI